MALPSRQPDLVQRARKGKDGLLHGAVVVYDGVHAHVVVSSLHQIVVYQIQVKAEF